MKKIITVLLIFVFAAQGCYTAVSAEPTYDADRTFKGGICFKRLWESSHRSRGCIDMGDPKDEPRASLPK